jgi:hypothetical protein
MHSFDSGPTGAQFHQVNGGDEPERHSVFSLLALIAVVVVLAVVALAILFALLGFVVSVLGTIIKVAVFAAIAVFLWRRVLRRCR